eukprot:9116901-Pyramimonas_sp.AAC.1
MIQLASGSKEDNLSLLERERVETKLRRHTHDSPTGGKGPRAGAGERSMMTKNNEQQLVGIRV